jgi:hypothetical protein
MNASDRLADLYVIRQLILQRLIGVDKIGVFMVKDSPIRQVVMDVYSIPESAMELYGDDCERGVMPDAQQ